MSGVKCSSRGFTLIETLLVFFIFSVLSFTAVNFVFQFQSSYELNDAISAEVAALREARELSRGVSSDARWGVKIATGTVTLFQGNSFAARNSAFDEERSISSNILITGVNEFVFTKLAATTTTIGKTTLTHSSLGESGQVGVNSNGVVSY